jgi:hypothetical protein
MVGGVVSGAARNRSPNGGPGGDVDRPNPDRREGLRDPSDRVRERWEKREVAVIEQGARSGPGAGYRCHRTNHDWLPFGMEGRPSLAGRDVGRFRDRSDELAWELSGRRNPRAPQEISGRRAVVRASAGVSSRFRAA